MIKNVIFVEFLKAVVGVLLDAVVPGSDRFSASFSLQQRRARQVPQSAVSRGQGHPGQSSGLDRLQQLPRVLSSPSATQVQLPAE